MEKLPPMEYLRYLTEKTREGAIKWCYKEELHILEAVVDEGRMVLTRTASGAYLTSQEGQVSLWVNRLPKIILPGGVLWSSMHHLFTLALDMSSPTPPLTITRYRRAVK